MFWMNAHVFQIDQETKKKWIPSCSDAVKVSVYHDSALKTYRIIAIDGHAKVRGWGGEAGQVRALMHAILSACLTLFLSVWLWLYLYTQS